MQNIGNLFVRLFVISLLTFPYFSIIVSLFGAGAAPFFRLRLRLRLRAKRFGGSGSSSGSDQNVSAPAAPAPAPAPALSKAFRRLRLQLRFRPKCVGSGGSGSGSGSGSASLLVNFMKDHAEGHGSVKGKIIHACPERPVTIKNVPEQIEAPPSSPKQWKHENVIPNSSQNAFL